MFKHKAIVAAGLLVAAFSAHAGPQITPDPYVFYAPNPVADPVPTPQDFKRAAIARDPSVFYAANPVADPVATPLDVKHAQIAQDPYVFYAPNPVAGMRAGALHTPTS